MRQNESLVFVQKKLRARDTSETCNSLPTSSGKVADVIELIPTLDKSSCSVDKEDITSKIWNLNKAIGNHTRKLFLKTLLSRE